MSQHPVHHATFAITRDFEAPVARLWGAFARQDLKDRWFGAHGDAVVITERTFDFRPGGRETAVGHWKTGTVSNFQSTYHDIVEGQRIVYVYDMFVNDWKMSVSLATIEVEARGSGSRLTITEQGAFFGEEGAKHAAGRAQGTAQLMGMLGDSLVD